MIESALTRMVSVCRLLLLLKSVMRTATWNVPACVGVPAIVALVGRLVSTRPAGSAVGATMLKMYVGVPPVPNSDAEYGTPCSASGSVGLRIDGVPVNATPESYSSNEAFACWLVPPLPLLPPISRTRPLAAAMAAWS